MVKWDETYKESHLIGYTAQYLIHMKYAILTETIKPKYIGWIDTYGVIDYFRHLAVL